MNYGFAIENRDVKRIDKLNKLTNKETFFDDVRNLVKNVTSDHTIKRWQCLAECRYNELITGVENVVCRIDYINGKFIQKYYAPDGTEVFAQ